MTVWHRGFWLIRWLGGERALAPRCSDLIVPAVALLIAAAVAGAAQAITISASAGLGAGNAPDASGAYQAYRTSAAVLDAGGTAGDTVGQQIPASAVYRGVGVADDAYSVSTCPAPSTPYPLGCRVHVFDVTFFTYAGPGITYDVSIHSEVLAFLRVHNDDFGGTGWSLFRPVSGTLNGIANSALDLPGFSGWQSATSISGTVERQNMLTLTDLSGAQTFSLRYRWETAVGSNNDEGLMGLGLTANTQTICTVCAYTGSPNWGRQHGFYVTATTEVTSVPIPEPESAVLTALGLAGLAGLVAQGRRRSPA